MLFNSLEFVLFLSAVLLVYFVLVPARWQRARKMTLLMSSYLFYASWNPPFVLLLLGSTVLDFLVGLRMEGTDSLWKKRMLLLLSLVGNLGVLGFFKYGGFVIDQYYAVANILSPQPTMPPAWDILLPVGISFYTFQSLSYSIDLYRGGQRACRSFLDFALFVSFFPQLVAGPIVRSSEFLPQLAQRQSIEPSDIELAWVRIAAGLVKKVVLADTLGEYADSIFQFPNSFGAPNVLLAMYAYAYQIYFDFSGYSDIAIGLAALFGYRIPENFDRPYQSASPREFWQRWHISLSTWLRDYLYVSLGGNRHGVVRTYVSLAVTMLLGGLWHGASWNFVVWGALHGAWLAAHRFLTRGREKVERGKAVRLLKQVGTFHMVCLAWVFFRAPDLGGALSFLRRLLVWDVSPHSMAVVALIGVGVSLVLHVSEQPMALRERYRRLPAVAQGLGFAAAAALTFLSSPETSRFIYFQF